MTLMHHIFILRKHEKLRIVQNQQSVVIRPVIGIGSLGLGRIDHSKTAAGQENADQQQA